MSEDLPYYSEAALAKQQAISEKTARGEEIEWTDIMGAWETNPALPYCPRVDIDSNVQCSLPNHHEGPHRAEVTW
jgi:hypothetical protein